MTIRHLRIFITVAECGKMNLAAKNLYISQPSVSQAIQELEKYYGTLLFERLSQRLYLTDSGKKLLPYAKNVLRTFEELDQMMKIEGEHPIVRVGASVSVGTSHLVGLVEEMKKQVVGVDIQALVHNTAMIEQKILESELDIGLVEGVVEHKDLVKVPILKDELVIVVGRKHPFYHLKKVGIQQLDQMGIISREGGSKTRNQYEQLLVELGVTLKQKWICTNTEAIKNAVKIGEHMAILSRMILNEELSSGELKVVNVENIHVYRSIMMIYHKNKYISPTLEAFMNIIKENCQQL